MGVEELIEKQWYCVGYMFSPDFSKVVLVRKNRPKWQAGLLNGVGGKVERNETVPNAMEREFLEETGIFEDGWKEFALLKFPAALVWFYRAASPLYDQAKTLTDEAVGVYDVAAIQQPGDIVPNVRWLIPMALSFQRGEKADSFMVEEVYDGVSG